jgi:hypothetical protein
MARQAAGDSSSGAARSSGGGELGGGEVPLGAGLEGLRLGDALLLAHLRHPGEAVLGQGELRTTGGHGRLGLAQRGSGGAVVEGGEEGPILHLLAAPDRDAEQGCPTRSWRAARTGGP